MKIATNSNLLPWSLDVMDKNHSLEDCHVINDPLSIKTGEKKKRGVGWLVGQWLESHVINSYSEIPVYEVLNPFGSVNADETTPLKTHDSLL